MFDINIRLIQGFINTMRRSGMVAFSVAGGGLPVHAGRQQVGEVHPLVNTKL
jgi:hypothetical protein